jgi:soluble lytic murein transglycosylase
MKSRIVLFITLFVCHTLAAAQPATADARAQFLLAHKLAKTGMDWRKLAPTLESYPLRPYLEHAALVRAPRPDSAAIQAFIERNGDQPVTRSVRSQLLSRRVIAKDWTGVRALDVPTLALHDRCHVIEAEIALGLVDGLKERGRALWLNPRSLPTSCNALGAWLRKQGALDADTVWARIELAVAASQSGLVRALASELPPTSRVAVQHLADLLADSVRARRAAKAWPDDGAHRRAMALGIARIAARDDDLAAALWREFSARFKFEDAEKYRVIDAIALYRANSYASDATSWLSLLPPGKDSASTREWRLREALARRDLKAAQAAVDRFDAAQLADPRWQYWRARVADLAGEATQAEGLYRALAKSPTFFGFLAAERAQLPYALCPIPAAIEGEQDKVLAQPGFARAFELYAIGWLTEARREWDAALVGVDAGLRQSAVALADARGWYDRAPFALTAGDDLRFYSLRFPLAHRDLVTASAAQHALSTGFVYGIIRAESAWVHDAKSGANAYGLMQLIPETARRMAKLEKRAFASPHALFDPALNVALGSRYLSTVLARYDGAHWLAAASYNAGPGRVDAWLAARGQLETDLFIETMPFKETREYVARVLAFAVIYDWRLHGKAFSLDYALAHSDAPPPPRRAVACPDMPTVTPAVTKR